MMSPFHMRYCSRYFVLAVFIGSRLAVNAEWRQHLDCVRLASSIDFPKGIWVKKERSIRITYLRDFMQGEALTPRSLNSQAIEVKWNA